MDFSINVAKTLARRSCKDCFGRGYVTISWAGDKIPVMNPYETLSKTEQVQKNNGEKYEKRTYYKTEKFKVQVTGVKPTIEFQDWCCCTRKKAERLSKMNEVKSGG